MARSKIALVGGGRIGGLLALLVAQHELGDVVLLDLPARENLVKGKALDISGCMPLLKVDAGLRGTADWKNIEGADVTIITVGEPRRPGMTREDLLAVNLKAIRVVAENVRRLCPNAFNIVLTNPLDAMVFAFHKLTGFPKHRVAGLAGVLDTSRFRSFVALELGVSVEDVAAIVLGGRNPKMVPLTRLATVGGIPLADLMPQAKIDAIVERTREAGTEIVNLLESGGPYFSPAVSAVLMAEAYLKDKKRVCACAALCEGEYGVNGYFIGVPAVIGAGGVERILEVKLTAEEKQMFAESLEIVIKATAETRL